MDELEIKQLEYDPGTDRLLFGDYGLHCGEVLEVLLPAGNGGAWVKVSLEVNMAGQWYMPRHKGVTPAGLWARM